MADFSNIPHYRLGMSTEPGAMTINEEGQMIHLTGTKGYKARAGAFVRHHDAMYAVVTENKKARAEQRKIAKKAEIKLRHQIQEHMDMTNSFLEELLLHTIESNKLAKKGKPARIFPADFPYPTLKVLREQITRNREMIDANYARLEKLGATL